MGSAGAALVGLLALSGAAHADCSHALGMLEQQLRLISEATPLMRDREAALQEGSRVPHTIDKELRDRTRMSAGGLAGDASRSPDPARHEAAMAEARAAIAQARDARDRGEQAACQQAVSDGLEAVRRARGTL